MSDARLDRVEWAVSQYRWALYILGMGLLIVVGIALANRPTEIDWGRVREIARQEIEKKAVAAQAVAPPAPPAPVPPPQTRKQMWAEFRAAIKTAAKAISKHLDDGKIDPPASAVAYHQVAQGRWILLIGYGPSVSQELYSVAVDGRDTTVAVGDRDYYWITFSPESYVRRCLNADRFNDPYEIEEADVEAPGSIRAVLRDPRDGKAYSYAVVNYVGVGAPSLIKED